MTAIAKAAARRPTSLTGAQEQVAARGTYRSMPPLFNHEGPDQYSSAFSHNAEFAKPPVMRHGAVGPYQTPLSAPQEHRFEQWVTANRIPFDPAARTSDYDMRGFWLAQAAGGQGRATNGHFPDTFKTPYDTTFSNESKYATGGNPFAWVGNKLVDQRTGQVIFG